MATLKYTPTFVAVIFVAALSSALMSTSDSSILAGASVVTENILPFWRPGMSDRQKLVWTRIMVVIIGTISIGIAGAIATIYRLATISWAILLVGLFVPFAFGMYWKKANRCGAIAAFLGGFLAWLIGFFYFFHAETQAANTLDGVLNLKDAVWDSVYISCTPALFVSLALMIAVSLITQRRDPPMPLTDVDGQPLPLKKRLGWLPPKELF